MSSPDLRRYSVTTFEPGARLVFTHGFRVRPRSNAFFATRPAPIMTLGFDVLVQLVIAAMHDRTVLEVRVATAGRRRRPSDAPPAVADTCDEPPASAPFFDEDAIIELSPAWKPLFACFSDTRSCGRFGPARHGSTVARSSSTVSV